MALMFFQYNAQYKPAQKSVKPVQYLLNNSLKFYAGWANKFANSKRKAR